MKHNSFLIALVLLASIFAGTAFATAPTVTITDPLANQITGGNIIWSFTVTDANYQGGPTENQIDVNLYYSDTLDGAGSKKYFIYNDTNLSDASGITCSDYNFLASPTCTYTWDTSAVTRGYYYLDYNFSSWTPSRLINQITFGSSGKIGVNGITPISSSNCGLLQLVYLALIAALLIGVVVSAFALQNGADLQTVLVGWGIIAVFMLFIFMFIGSINAEMCTNIII